MKGEALPSHPRLGLRGLIVICMIAIALLPSLVVIPMLAGLSRRLRCEPTRESLKELRPWYVLVLERGNVQVFLFGTSTDAKIKPDERVYEMARRIETL